MQISDIKLQLKGLCTRISTVLSGKANSYRNYKFNYVE